MKTKRGLNGCVLKWIAIILMAIDHFGASILENFLLNVWDVSPLGDLLRDYPDYWDLVLMADRVIGRSDGLHFLCSVSLSWKDFVTPEM